MRARVFGGRNVTDQAATRNIKGALRTVRIVSGLILLAFVSTHLLNASFGLISIDAMDATRPFLTGVWDIPPLGAILSLSLLVHFLLGLWSIYERPTFKTNAQDIVQLVTALCVVPLMATHVIGIMMVNQAGIDIDYAMTIRIMWIENPSIGLLQIIVVTVVWLHGCAGLLIWLRSQEWARNVVLWIYPIAIAIPVLSLLGFSEAGREVLEAAANPAAVDVVEPADTGAADTAAPQPVLDFAFIKALTNWVIWGSLAFGIFTLVARAMRLQLGKQGQFEVTRDDQMVDPVRAGLSLLDAFQERHHPHASLCQGRGRCGTCAVEVLSSEFPLSDAGPLERRTLIAKGLPETARLACQLKPAGGKIAVRALYPADYTFHHLDDDKDTPDQATSVEATS